MDKRLTNFLFVSLLLFVIYSQLVRFLIPPPVKEQDVAEVDKTEQLAEQQPSQPSEEPKPAIVSDTEIQADEAEAQAREPAKQRWYTLGSLDPASGYSMLVTFNSKGAAVERIELNNERYQDIEDKTAYIGHMAWTTDVGGVKVNVVGDGTPAALAGIQVNDVISKIGELETTSPTIAEEALRKFEFGAEVPITLSRDDKTINLKVASRRRPMEVIRPEAYPINETEDSPLAGQMQPESYLVSLRQVGHHRAEFDQDELTSLPSLRHEQWQLELEVNDGKPSVEFRFPVTKAELTKLGLEGSFVAIKRFSLDRHPEAETTEAGKAEEQTDSPDRRYHVNFELEFQNESQTPIEIGYRLDGPTGLPLEGWWYAYKTHPHHWMNAVGIRDIVCREVGGAHLLTTNSQITKRAKQKPEQPDFNIFETPKKLQYAGVDAQYFHSAVLPNAGKGYTFDRVEAFALAKVDRQKTKRTPVTFRADASTFVLPPGKTELQNFQIFAGPKHPDVLSQYGLDECIVYGWFKLFAKFMGNLLHMLHGLVGNYGISIILLTLIVRACMFPIGRQQAKSAKMMQTLAPELKKIKAKYPDDPMKAQQEQSAFMKKHNVNPLMGCLPAFLQLPIFVGLYRSLSVDIELRQTPLVEGLGWCSNLAAPDMLWRWSEAIPFEPMTGYTGYLGPYLNVLPLISTALFLVHQHLFTPPPQDEQQAMQQKLMKGMMIVMVVVFFRVPAGLCLYFITSSLWALGERLTLPKDLDPRNSNAKPNSDKKSTAATLAEKATQVLTGESGNGKETVAARKKRRKKKAKK